MSTFAGSYLKEPADLAMVCTEADIIACCDDPGGEDMRDLRLFSDLSGPQLAAVQAVINPMIAAVESKVESYARRQGYAIPLAPIDSAVKEIAARMVWIDLRQHAKSLTATDADSQRETIRKGELTDLAKGVVLLTALRDTTVTPPASNVYSITDAAARDIDGTTPRFSRKALEGF